MKKYLLALLFVFTSSPCFSTSVEELTHEYKQQVLNKMIPDQDIINYLEVKKSTQLKVYKNFLKTESAELTFEKDTKEYSTHFAVTTNRPELFGYLVKDNAKLGKCFKNPMVHLAPYFEDNPLSEKFIPLMYIALCKALSTREADGFFSFLYVNYIPKLLKIHENTMIELQECDQNLGQAKTELREKDHTLSERQRVLEENRLALETLSTEKTDLTEQHLQLTEQERNLRDEHTLLTRQHTQLGINYGALQETLRERNNSLFEKDQALDANRVSLERLDGLAEQHRQLTERQQHLQRQYTQLDHDHRGLQGTLREKDHTLSERQRVLEENRVALERLNTEKDDLAEQHLQLTEQERNLRDEHTLLTRQHTQLGINYGALQETLRERNNSLFEKDQALDANRVSLERLDGLAEQHRQLTERQQHLQRQYTQLGINYRGLQGTLREKDHTLSERQRVLEENRVALGTLNTEKTDLAGQYRQAVLAAKTLQNNIALFEKQNAVSEVQLRILQEKSLSQSPEVKEKVTVVSSHEASAPLPIESSLGTSVYKTDSSSEKTLVLSLENQKTDPLHLVTPQVIVEGNIAEQAMEARRALSSQYSKKYARLASQQTKAEIAQTESMEQLKIEEEKANLAFEKNKRAETDRQLLEMQIESQRNRN
jgi:chromosome segregation ATPase